MRCDENYAKLETNHPFLKDETFIDDKAEAWKLKHLATKYTLPGTLCTRNPTLVSTLTRI